MKTTLRSKSSELRPKWGKAQYRIAVFRSLKHIYVYVVELKSGKTLISESDLTLTTKGKIKKAKEVGKKLAQKIKKSRLKNLVFDRGRYRYHGRVKAVADGIREEGVEI